MTYILRSESEAQRLVDQASMEAFSLEGEIAGVKILPGYKILDAGCGSGVLCHYLERKYTGIQIEGCDLDEVGLAHARNNSLTVQTKFFKHNIQTEALPGTYNLIFNRFVAHHLGIDGMMPVLKSFYNALNHEGQLCIIDIDGLLVNLATPNRVLCDKINAVKKAFSGDLHIARMIPSLLHDIGFKNISWEIQTTDFKGEERIKEVSQWKRRFDNSLPFYVNIFGNETEARSFFEEYSQEAQKEHVPLFYNKFVVQATKR